MDLVISPAYTADKLNSIFSLANRSGGLTDNSGGINSRHRIAEVTAVRVSEEKAYSDYIKKSEFETMNVFERESNFGTRLNENIQMTQPDRNIQMT